MQVKTKIYWQLISIVGALSIPFTLYNDFINSNYYNLRFWFMLLTSPFFFILFLFIGPMARITFTEDKINVYWKIGVGRFHIYEMTKYQIYYKNITGVLSIFLVWFPIHVLWISGDGNSLILGAILTKKKETFKILANKINQKVLSDEAKKILNKYKMR